MENMNSYMNSWTLGGRADEFIFSMNSYMNSDMKCLPERFLAHLSFHEIMLDILDFGLFFMGEIILS